jgi:hypothetical protein
MPELEAAIVFLEPPTLARAMHELQLALVTVTQEQFVLVREEPQQELVLVMLELVMIVGATKESLVIALVELQLQLVIVTLELHVLV